MESENKIYSRYQNTPANKITDNLNTGVNKIPCITLPSDNNFF